MLETLRIRANRTDEYGGNISLVVDVRIEEKDNVYPYKDIDQNPCKKYVELTMVGSVRIYGVEWHSCQCYEAVRQHFGHIATLARLCDIWERWHLNGLRPGTRAQQEALRSEEFRTIMKERGDWYLKACDYLTAKGLKQDNGYVFGRSWLVEHVPSEVLKEVRDIAELFK